MAYSPTMCLLVLQGMIEMVMGAAQVCGPGLGTLVFYVSQWTQYLELVLLVLLIALYTMSHSLRFCH